MRITWSLPVPGEPPDSGRGDVVRARGLVEALRTEGHEVRLVAAAADAHAGASVSAYRAGVRRLLPRALALPLRDAGRLALARVHARRVAAAAREQGAQVVVETQVHLVPSGRLAARRVGLPLVLDDCSPPAEETALGGGLPAAMVVRSFRAQADAARGLVVSSAALADALAPWGSDRIHVVPNGVDLVAFERPGRAAARRELGLDDAFVAAFVGSFQPWHRLDLLMEAAAALEGPLRPRLLLVGDGPGREAALARAGRLGIRDRVIAPGAVPPGEVPRLLAAADAGVLPGSNGWGQPMKLVEYAAAGLPAVAPDLAPVREVLRPGQTGLLFAPGDGEALRDDLARLAADPVLRDRLGGAARAASLGWSWRERARALARVLEEARA
ncbi:MAG TPA: glycosyltransferase family 4 protein [Longimicrobiales bacterium]|nr:glycosyltransferase family 4 protein [Longimicrobiales bacterium]